MRLGTQELRGGWDALRLLAEAAAAGLLWAEGPKANPKGRETPGPCWTPLPGGGGGTRLPSPHAPDFRDELTAKQKHCTGQQQRPGASAARAPLRPAWRSVEWATPWVHLCPFAAGPPAGDIAFCVLIFYRCVSAASCPCSRSSPGLGPRARCPWPSAWPPRCPPRLAMPLLSSLR